MEISDVKTVIAKRQIVECGGIQYYPVGYRLTLDEKTNQWRHSMELRDINAKNSVCIALLKNINIVEGKVFRNGRIIDV